MKPTRCARADCRNRKPCPLHPEGWKNAKSTLPSNWGSLVARTRKAYQGKCARCRKECWATGSCDHIINRASGGTHHISNLQWLCRDCHKAKSQRESKEGIKKSAQRRRSSNSREGPEHVRKRPAERQEDGSGAIHPEEVEE
jgi:5-methylcytosine-specific restriction protein A